MVAKAIPQDGSKKTYRQPVLKVYGTVEKLTASIGVSGMADGGTGSMFRTH